MLRKFKLLGDMGLDEMGLDEMGGHWSLSVPALFRNKLFQYLKVSTD